jgi:hypothetical protein
MSVPGSFFFLSARWPAAVSFTVTFRVCPERIEKIARPRCYISNRKSPSGTV